MEESVAIAAQVAARVADDDGDGLAVVVVVAGRPRGRVRCRAAPAAPATVPLAGGESLDVILVEDAEGGEGEPQDGVAHALAGVPAAVVEPGQVQDVLGYRALGHRRPLVAQAALEVRMLDAALMSVRRTIANHLRLSNQFFEHS